jgi:hypothetical protein
MRAIAREGKGESMQIMKMPSRNSNALRALLIVSMCLLLCPWASRAAGLRLAPARGNVAAWHELYWSWLYGQVTIPLDHNGNAAIGNTILMSLPDATGDGTPGSIDITLDAGQSFFLPLTGTLGTSYTDGTPPDPFTSIANFTGMTVKLTLDGKTVVNESNLLDYYEQGYFATPIELNSPPLDSIIYFQSLGLLQHPLPPGRHVIQLDEKQTVPEFGYTAEYHNTFNITVHPRGR